MPRRFANDKIAQLVYELETPVSQRVRGEQDPYYYGASEQSWKNAMVDVHKQLQGKRPGEREQTLANIEKVMRVSPKEAEMLWDYSRNPRNKTTRHEAFGVPHASSGESIARRALEASGVPVALNHFDDPRATDLQVMIGKVRQYMDVQNRYVRPGMQDKASLGIIQGLNNSEGVRAYDSASPDTEIQDIIGETVRRSRGTYAPDKLYQERGIQGVPESYVKDYLIGSRFASDQVRNMTGMGGTNTLRHGNYDPMIPSGFDVTDLNRVRDELYPMTKRDFESQLGGQLIRGATDKLKLQLPHDALMEIGRARKPLITDEVNEVLTHLIDRSRTR